MAGYASARTLSELERQNRVLKNDFVGRTLALGALFSIVGLRIGPAVPLAAAICYLCSEAASFRFFARYPTAPTVVTYSGLVISGVTGGASVVIAMIALWRFGADYERYVAIIGLTGALMHVILLRTPHMPLAIASALPVMLSFFVLVALFYQETQDVTFLMISTFGAIVLIVYFINGMLSLNRMQTELLNARTKALDASAGKTRFLATMSHELRTPLNAIMGVSQLLRTDLSSAETPRRIDALAESALSMREIVDDVLDIQSVENGHIEIRRRPSRLVKQIQAIVDLHQPLAQSRGLHLSLRVLDGVPEVASFDPLRMRQCLTNLLNNALKYTEEGSVRVVVMQPDTEDCLHIEVRDTGPGLPAGVREHLFELGHKPTGGERVAGGAGLGLSISRGIARAMGGDVSLYRTGPAGTTFRLSFPAPLAELPTSGSALKPSAGEIDPAAVAARILVVDDVETNRMITEAFLRAEGHQTESVSGGYAALDRLEAGGFDLVLLDMNMPDLDGLETFAKIREIDVDLPVIALTADALPEDRTRYLAHGLDGYVPKPVDRVALIQEVHAHLRNARAA